MLFWGILGNVCNAPKVGGAGGAGSQCGYGANVHLVKKFFLKLKIENEKRNFEKTKKKKKENLG